MDFDEFKEEVTTMLGGNLVDVELTESDFKTAYRKARRVLRQKGHDDYKMRYFPIDLKRNQWEYPVPEQVNYVTRVLRNKGLGINPNDAFDMAAYQDLFNMTRGGFGFDLLTYEMIGWNVEDASKYSASDIEIDFNEHDSKIYLRSNPKETGIHIVECYLELSDEEYYEMQWVIDWSIAECKTILGTAYRKFQNLPGPMGQASLGGDSLIQEAQKEKEQLLKDIENFVDGDIDWGEVTFG